MAAKNSLSFSDEMKQFHEEINPRLHHLLGSRIVKVKVFREQNLKYGLPMQKK